MKGNNKPIYGATGEKNMSGRFVKIGLMQVTNDDSWPVEKCQQQLLHLAEKCCMEGADLVLMPEFYQYKSIWDKAVPAELVDKYAGAFKRGCSKLAKSYGAYLVPWDLEKDEKGNVYNTSYILDRQGNETGRYRKVHLPFGEADWGLSRGTEFKVFELDFGKVGIMLCYDNYYCESARILSLMGAELILFPLYGDTLKDQWEIRLKARAIDNSVFVAPCHIASSPEDQEISYTGMISPSGEVLCKLSEEDSYSVIDIEVGRKVITNTSATPGKCEDIKQMLLKLRNPSAYKTLLDDVETPDWKEIKFDRAEA